ncbi:MAG TPA: ATP-binding cassette domain-containing protein, partial [Chitinophagaceae bacterium]
MKVSLTDAGKRFNRDWIFRHLNYTFETGKHCVITGPNGSGKSTLLQVINGSLQLNQGAIEWRNTAGAVSRDEVFRVSALCAPYLEVVEEMTLVEFLDFHQQFKPFISTVTTLAAAEMVGLETASQKQIRQFSSGMKQRVKLAQAFFSETPLLLLDEPCTNLDESGIALYHRLVKDF